MPILPKRGGEGAFFVLNDARVPLGEIHGRAALSVLREDFGLKSMKVACSPEGACGCCTVLIDGSPRLSCTLPARKLAGTRVLTLEGLSGAEREIYARAFDQGGGAQCGYCTPGIVLRVKSLLDGNPDPTDKEIRESLKPHVCRCTGWEGIFRSVRLAAALRRGDAPTPPPRGGGVGQEVPRKKGVALVLGDRPFLQDLELPGMLHGALVWTPRPRCRLQGLGLDVARAVPGVRAIVTAADVPGDRFKGPIVRDWPVMVAMGEETRCSADIFAAVAADTPEIARHAASLVEVEVEDLPPLLDLEEAARRPEQILSVTRYVTGEPDDALARASLVIRERFETQRVDQAFLEPEASIVRPEPDGGLRVWSCGQGVFDDRHELARVLGLPPERLRVELVAPGGAFGGKEDLNVQPHAALLALAARRPVKVALNMAETLRFHPKRHPMILDYEIGTDGAGRLLAVRARILADTGGYASVGAKVVERAAGHATGAYAVPHVSVEALAVLTNNPVSGAMRGFGVNQVAFALEGCLDRAAERLGIDPFEIRRLNVARPGERLGNGQVLPPDVAALPTLDALRPAWDAARAAGRAVGVACGMKNVGMGNGFPEKGRAILHVLSGERVVLYTGFTEMGQGHDTVMSQFAAEATGLPYDLFDVRCETSQPVGVGMTTASRGTFLGGRAVQDAGRALREALALCGGDLDALAGRLFHGEYLAPPTDRPGDRQDPTLHFCHGFAAQIAILDETGALVEIVAAQDVGRAIHPTLCRGQVEGAVMMGVGQALCEELICEGGMPDPRYRALGVIRADRAPHIEVILVQQPDPEGPWGARGIGETGIVPTAAAIASALRGYEGRWRTRLPMRDAEAARRLLHRG